jgi:hypothetical protein
MGKRLSKTQHGKYLPDELIAMFRKAAALRNQMRDAGFTDNGGAIHSAERILNILGLRLKYPGLAHINNLRSYHGAEFSVEALKLHQSGGKVLIEHVTPTRHLTRMAIDQIDRGVTNAQFTAFVKRHFKLVLLSPAETQRLNRQNRSTVARDRLRRAGIRVAKATLTR